MDKPLVSIIIATKNSAGVLKACLKSVKNQTYQNIETIIVDNNSTDNTKEIAREFTDKVFNQGPERSSQRNFGIGQAQGVYIVIIDSDMELSTEVIAQCVEQVANDKTNAIKGLIIPEESFGIGFWAQCKKLERSYYQGVRWMEAARFFAKDAYTAVGGYNVAMVSGEDWDLSQRIEKIGKIEYIKAYIYHNEGKIDLRKSVKKKYYYAKTFTKYKDTTQNTNVNKQTGIIARYKLFFKQPQKILQNPVLWLGMIFMKTCEFGFGGVGYLFSLIQK